MTLRHERRRLGPGLPRLEAWSVEAGQSDKNALYEMLFAVVEGSLFRSYEIVDGGHTAGEFLVTVRPNLAALIELSRADTFGVLYIGSPEAEALDDEAEDEDDAGDDMAA